MKKVLFIFFALIGTVGYAQQLELPFPVKVVNPKPLNFYYFKSDNVPWASVSEANSGIPIGVRHRGMTVLIDTVEYWYMPDTLDVNLNVKTTSGGGGISKAGNGLSVLSGDSVVISGGSIDISQDSLSIWAEGIVGENYNRPFFEIGYLKDGSGFTNPLIRFGASRVNPPASSNRHSFLLFNPVADDGFGENGVLVTHDGTDRNDPNTFVNTRRELSNTGWRTSVNGYTSRFTLFDGRRVYLEQGDLSETPINIQQYNDGEKNFVEFDAFVKLPTFDLISDPPVTLEDLSGTIAAGGTIFGPRLYLHDGSSWQRVTPDFESGSGTTWTGFSYNLGGFLSDNSTINGSGSLGLSFEDLDSLTVTHLSADVSETWMVTVDENGVLGSQAISGSSYNFLNGLIDDGGDIYIDSLKVFDWIEAAVDTISSGGIGGSVGATDNAILRADVGSGVVQNSPASIDDSGNITLGLAATAGTSRTISAQGSEAAINTIVESKGTGRVIIGVGNDTEPNIIQLGKTSGSPDETYIVPGNWDQPVNIMPDTSTTIVYANGNWVFKKDLSTGANPTLVVEFSNNTRQLALDGRLLNIQESGTSFTLDDSYIGNNARCTAATTISVTVPKDILLESVIVLTQWGDGNINLVEGTDVDITGKTSTTGKGDMIWLYLIEKNGGISYYIGR